MISPFIQHIGMWYAEHSNAERVFDYMYQWHINDDNVQKVIKSKSEMVFYFCDGGWIRFLPVSTSMRGIRCTDSYLIDYIDSEIIKSVIAPCTTWGNGGIWLLDTKDEDSIYSSIAFHRQKWSEEKE